MNPVPIDIHSVIDVAYMYRHFPRTPWLGKVMVYVAGETAALVGNGSVLRIVVEPSGSERGQGESGSLFTFEGVVEEMPYLRLPEGIRGAAIMARPEGLDFGLDGRLLSVRSAAIVGGTVMGRGTEKPVRAESGRGG